MMITKRQARKDWRAIAAAFWNFWTSKTGAFILAVSGIAFGYYIFYITLPLYINSLCKGYKFYIRQERYYPAWETNLFCIHDK